MLRSNQHFRYGFATDKRPFIADQLAQEPICFDWPNLAASSTRANVVLVESLPMKMKTDVLKRGNRRRRRKTFFAFLLFEKNISVRANV